MPISLLLQQYTATADARRATGNFGNFLSNVILQLVLRLRVGEQPALRQPPVGAHAAVGARRVRQRRARVQEVAARAARGHVRRGEVEERDGLARLRTGACAATRTASGSGQSPGPRPRRRSCSTHLRRLGGLVAVRLNDDTLQGRLLLAAVRFDVAVESNVSPGCSPGCNPP